MNTRKLLTTGVTAVVAVLALATDAHAFGKGRGGGCCGGGAYAPAYSGGCYGSSYGGYSGSSYGGYSGGCYGSGYGGSYAPYSGGCYGSGYGYGAAYAAPGYAGYASVGGPGSYSGAAAARAVAVPTTVTPGSGVVVQSSPEAVVPAAAVAPQVVVPAGGVLPSGYATYPAGYGGFSSGYAPAVVPAAVGVPYSVPYGVATDGAVLNYGITRTGRGLFRR